MPTIEFFATPKLPADMIHLGYAKGQRHTLPVDQCERWIRRNVAAYVEVPAVEPVAPPVIPVAPEPGVEGAVASQGIPGPDLVPPLVSDEAPAEFDPTSAPLDDVRAFLAERGVSVHHRTGEEKIRLMAIEALGKGEQGA